MASGRLITATRPGFVMIWERPLTSKPWSSATWATPPAPASPSPATPPPARTNLYGDYLINAQGEDVVAGIRNTSKIQFMGNELPEAYAAIPRESRKN
jgi:hypothetical protein